jgi:hypothetical protein
MSFAAATLGKMVATLSSSSSTKWIRKPSPLRWDLGLTQLGFHRLLSPPSSTPCRNFSWCPLSASEVVMVAEQHRWKHPRWVLLVLRCRHWWRPPRAMPGWPREHCLAMLARSAPGRLVSACLLLHLPFSSLASVLGHLGWVPSSLCWCYSYCMLLAWCLLSVKCGCAIACDDLAASWILYQCTLWQTC